jgi:predicted TIM-barrel fold metal-dependent hydrolase
MRLICIEEHAIDPAIMRAAQSTMDRDAPYMRTQSSANAAAARDERGQHVVDLAVATKMGVELGAGRLRDMDEHGIDMQIVSYSSPAQLAPPEQAVALTTAANDRLATAVAANPQRLQGFAVLPWQTPLAAADELDRAVTELGLKAVLIVGRPGETFLDDTRYEPVLSKLAELGVPLYLHPYYPIPQVQQAYYAGLPAAVSTEFSLGAWGWHHEAGIHLLRLILSGVFERFPALQVISGHWGEMVPFYLSRLDQVLPRAVTGLSATISEVFRAHVWVTPSGMFDEPHVRFVRDTVGFDRLIWSTDYPYVSMDGTRSFLDRLSLTERERQQITHGNAETLFRLPRTAGADVELPFVA